MTVKTTKLYNVMFPIWFLFVFPTVWLIIIPANFIVDSLVLLITLKCLHYSNPFEILKKKIWPIWIFGFIADIIGALLVIGLYMGLVEIYPSLGSDLIFFPGTCLVAIPGVALAGILIYFLNKKFSFRRTSLDKVQIHKICLMLACFTAPYTMLIPLYW